MKHTHYASKDNIDTCKICGKDIRDEVHLRNGQTAASYYRELEAENTRLKELNREMMEALKAECVDCYRGVTERCGDCKIRVVLAKAEGRGE